MFTVCSVIEDISKCITMDAKFPGDLVYVIGETKNELGGSEFYEMLGSIGLRVPNVLVKEVMPHYKAVSMSIEEGLLTSCHAVTRGGLATHLALVAIAGELGMEIHLPSIPASGSLSVTQTLYSESGGRFIVTLAPAKKKRFEEIFSGMKTAQVGVTTESPRFLVLDAKGCSIIDEEIFSLKDSWSRPFGDII